MNHLRESFWRFAKSRPGVYIRLIVSISLGAFGVYMLFVYYNPSSKQASVRIAKESNAAFATWKSGRAGLENNEEFTRNLESIKTDDAPAEVKAAFARYVAAWERATEEMRRTGLSTAATEEIARSQLMFVQALKKATE